MEQVRNVRVLADEHHKPITNKPGSRSLPDYTPALVAGNTLTASVPPAINVVEADIDEMIWVWKKLRDDSGESVHGNEPQPATGTGDRRQLLRGAHQRYARPRQIKSA